MCPQTKQEQAHCCGCRPLIMPLCCMGESVGAAPAAGQLWGLFSGFLKPTCIPGNDPVARKALRDQAEVRLSGSRRRASRARRFVAEPRFR